MRINTNILSISAQRTLSQTTKAFNRALARLSSGSRINSARDDAAGLSIATGLEAQRRGMLQAVRNMNVGRGFLDTADGALSIQSDILHRMRELALQATNGTLSDIERENLNTELQQLVSEFDRTAKQTEFNGVKLLDGSFTTTSIQVGTNKNQSIYFSLPSLQASDVFDTTTTTASGTGTFATRMTFVSSSSPYSINFADVSGDGTADLLIHAGSLLSVSLGNGNGTFQTSTTFTTGASVFGRVVVSDLNGDGKLDVTTSDDSTSYISVFLGNGNGTFQTRTTLALPGTSYLHKMSDINSDGFVDLLETNYSQATLGIRFGNGDGTFMAVSTIAVGGNTEGIEIADLNGDGKLDVVTADAAGDYISVLLGNGNGTFQTRTTINQPGHWLLVVGDFNEDGKIDVVSNNQPARVINLSLGNGDGTFQTKTQVASGVNAEDLQVYDFNDDGYLDLATADWNDGTASIFLGNGNGTFIETTVPTATTAMQVRAADLNGDGVLDLGVTNDGAGADTYSIYLGIPEYSTSTTSISISTESAAEDALDAIDRAFETLNSARANIGAIHSRLDYAESSALHLIENVSAARSQIIDVDFAIETAELARLQILQNAGIAVMAQANLSSKLVLELLQ